MLSFHNNFRGCHMAVVLGTAGHIDHGKTTLTASNRGLKAFAYLEVTPEPVYDWLKK